MKATVSAAGELVLPEVIREAAHIREGEIFEVDYSSTNRIILTRLTVGAEGGKSTPPPFLGVDPFPAGTLEAIYESEDPVWEQVEKAAIRRQPVPRFEE